MGKFKKVSGVKQRAQGKKQVQNSRLGVSKPKKQEFLSKKKSVALALESIKSEVKKKSTGLSSDVEERKNKTSFSTLGIKNTNQKLNKNMKNKKDTPEGKKPQTPKFVKPMINGNSLEKNKQKIESGKKKEKLENQKDIKKKKQKESGVRRNYVLLRQPSSSDEDEDDDQDPIQNLNETLDSSDEDDDEFVPGVEEDYQSEDTEISQDDSSEDDEVESETHQLLATQDSSNEDSSDNVYYMVPDTEQVDEDTDSDSSESDSDEDNEEEETSLKLQTLDATLDTSDEDDEDFVPGEDDEVNQSEASEMSENESEDETIVIDDSMTSLKEKKDVKKKSSKNVILRSSTEGKEKKDNNKKTATKGKKKNTKITVEESEEEEEGEEEEDIDSDSDSSEDGYLTKLPSFEEDAFREVLAPEKIRKVVEALVKQVKQECSQKKDQIFADYRYILQITCFKIPKCPRRMVKLKLKHSIVSEDDDVCFIVRDLKRGRRVDFEPTVHHYEDLFREKGIKGIKTIIPFNQIRTEYTTYENKIKLANLYDYFLCDGAIVGHAVGFLGKHFQKPRSTLYAVRMDGKDIAGEISKALHKTAFRQSGKGPTIAIPIANSNMTFDQITENIITIIDQLKEFYPGGLENIRNMNVRINLEGTSSLPIYVSLCRPPKDVPNVVGPKEEKIRQLKAKANEILKKFHVTQTGQLVKLDGKAHKRPAAEVKHEDVKPSKKMKKGNISSDEKTSKVENNKIKVDLNKKSTEKIEKQKEAKNKLESKEIDESLKNLDELEQSNESISNAKKNIGKKVDTKQKHQDTTDDDDDDDDDDDEEEDESGDEEDDDSGDEIGDDSGDEEGTGGGDDGEDNDEEEDGDETDSDASSD